MSTSPSTTLDTIRVLVVDDQPDIRFLVRKLAQRDVGARIEIVAEAADGRTAIETASCCDPDVILLDVHMPELDGIAALPALRAVAPNARIVMHSSAVGRREEALRRGADAWVSKVEGWDEVRRQVLGE